MFFVAPTKGQKSVDLSIRSGISTSRFGWSVAGDINGENPNILSEIKFNDIIRMGMEIESKLEVLPVVGVNISVGRYYTLHGNGTDIDYAADNRTQETYRLGFLSKKGKMAVYRLGVLFPVFRHEITTVSVGLSSIFCEQSFFLNSNKISDLNSVYSPQKIGYGFIVSTFVNLSKDYSISINVESRRIHYNATANWNLVEEFEHPISFRHKSTGFDIKTNLDISKSIAQWSELFVYIDHMFDKTGIGVDVLHQKGGIKTLTQFNGSKHQMAMAGLGWRIKFDI